MNKNSKIFVAGSTGLVGSAVVEKLKSLGYRNLLTPTSKKVDLTSPEQTRVFFSSSQPEYVFLCAAKVGGIVANNTYPADFIYTNLMIQNNVLNEAYRHKAKKLLFLGSSCIYPKHCPQPIKEEYLLSGHLEPTNKPYAIAKIAGLTMCESYNRQYGTKFISAMPTNLYGPRDNFDLNTSHVLPALIRKFHEALPNNPVTLWGTGSPSREFLYVDDLADACVELMLKYESSDPVNVGCGEDLTIKELALIIQRIVGHKGEIVWDTSKPDGTPRKLLDVSKIKSLGWSPKTSLEKGIQLSYNWFLEQQR